MVGYFALPGKSCLSLPCGAMTLRHQFSQAVSFKYRMAISDSFLCFKSSMMFHPASGKPTPGPDPGTVAMSQLYGFIPWGQRSFLFAAFTVSCKSVHCMAK